MDPAHDELCVSVERQPSTPVQGPRSLHVRDYNLGSGENIWLHLDPLPRGSRITVVVTSGTAEINGHPLPLNRPTSLSDSKINYFIHTWTGCNLRVTVPVTSHHSADCIVMRIRSSGTFAHLTGYLSHQRILIIDDNADLTTTLANYKYLHHGGEPRCPHVMVNLDCATETPNVVSVYFMQNGTIQPHNAADLLTDKKLSLFVNTIEQGIAALEALIDKAAVVTVYLHYAQRDHIQAAIKAFKIDCVLTLNDIVYHSVRRHNKDIVVDRLQPLIIGAGHQNGDDLVFHSVFLGDYMTHHFFSSALSSVYNRLNLPLALLPVGSHKSNGSHETKTTVTNNSLYAVVSGQGHALTFWGYVVVDHNGRGHSALPLQFILRYRLLYVKSFLCVCNATIK